jgi:poly(A) polymerase
LRLLEAADPASVLALMDQIGVLSAYLAEAKRIDVLRALVTIEGITVGLDAIRRLAALIEGGQAAACAVAERLRLSVAQRERLSILTALQAAPSPDLPGKARRLFFNRVDDAPRRDMVLLAWAEATARQHGALTRGEAEAWRALLDEAMAWQRRDLPIKGRDALALGLPPGPRVGELIDALTAWWEEGDFAADRAACLAELKRRLG